MPSYMSTCVVTMRTWHCQALIQAHVEYMLSTLVTRYVLMKTALTSFDDLRHVMPHEMEYKQHLPPQGIRVISLCEYDKSSGPGPREGQVGGSKLSRIACKVHAGYPGYHAPNTGGPSMHCILSMSYYTVAYIVCHNMHSLCPV